MNRKRGEERERTREVKQDKGKERESEIKREGERWSGSEREKEIDLRFCLFLDN